MFSGESRYNVLSITMSSIRQARQRRQVVQPVQAWLAGNWINTSQQQVDVIWVSRSQAGGELAADEVGEGGWVEIDLVAHAVELGVDLNVLCELD